MSDEDFEAYLTLLSRFLRLSPRQREDIRREFRAHLEDALEDERAHGVRREEALQRILDDFGDAAELAARFSALKRRRRWLMQGTMAAACIGFAILTLNFNWPGSNPPVAMEPSAALVGERESGSGEAPEAPAIRNALATNIESVMFEDAPLDQVFAWLNEFMQINLHVQWRRIENEGIERDTPITMNLSNVTAKCVLNFVVDEFAETDLDYAVLDNVLVVSTREALQRRATTEVYDVRDVLEMIGGGVDTAAVQSAARLASAGSGVAGGGRPQFGVLPAGGPGGVTGGGPGLLITPGPTVEMRERVAEMELTELLTNAIEPDTWASRGGVGYLQILNGVLVVRQYEGVHADIRELLADLREVAALQANR